MKAIFAAAMNTTCAMVKIRPEKNLGLYKLTGSCSLCWYQINP